MKEIQALIKRLESEIGKTPTGELRNLLSDVNIAIQHQASTIYANNQSMSFAVEFGYKQCEKGNNLQLALSEWIKISK